MANVWKVSRTTETKSPNVCYSNWKAEYFRYSSFLLGIIFHNNNNNNHQCTKVGLVFKLSYGFF